MIGHIIKHEGLFITNVEQILKEHGSGLIKMKD